MISKNGEAPLAATSGASISSETFEKPTMKSIAKVHSEYTHFCFGDKDIRIQTVNGDPWFVAKDVCDALQLTNSRKALMALDDDEKGVTSSYTLGGHQSVSIVSESGMYTLVLRCRDAVNKGSVPHAFRKWVTTEVLPSIRKTGVYEKPVVKKGRQSSETQLTPLRQTAERLITTGMGRIYPDIWKLVHERFEIEHIHQLTPVQVGEAVEYLNAMEGEYLGNANRQMSLGISFPMNYYDQYRWMRGIDDRALSAPWRFPANMLTPNGDNPNPLGALLLEMRQMGYEVEAGLFQLQALQHHLEMMRMKIDRISRTLQ